MEKFVIQGGSPLIGEIQIGGAKNAVLPLMIASLLTDQTIILDNVPYLSDVLTLCQLLEHLGVNIMTDGENKIGGLGNQCEDIFQLTLNACKIDKFLAPYDIVKKMRASFWVLGPLLARFGKAQVSLPGGCKIGARKIDLHLAVLRAMGATINLQDGYIIASTKGRLNGIQFTFSKISVGATINAIISATLAKGKSIFVNCAVEPEIVDLCFLLKEMGAEIYGAGSSTMTIVGKNNLQGAKHTVVPDRVEMGTYLAAVGLTGGTLKLKGVNCEISENLCAVFVSAGLNITGTNHSITVSSDKTINPVNIQTAPYPGFPTDMQAQFMSLMCSANGVSVLVENIFENRFMHVPELQRMGATILLKNNVAIITGNTKFKGATVTASDLRASVCLVLAGLAAEGETVICDIYHIDRGYSRIEKKLSLCGASIIRLAE